jgi:hypothetical protein
MFKQRYHYVHHDATPGAAPDRSAKTALHDSFPASDPVATTAVVGSRAVDLARLMKPQTEIQDGAMVLARLRDRTAARLAVEHLVRKVPLDRRRAAIRSGRNGTAILEVTAPAADVDRIAEILCRHGRAGRVAGRQELQG